ncbi:exodeoxyribonuclease V subunit alpha [Solirubrobacter taibaiensis]|nr:exodeoxyribonuclease V subunit alpha [Solirubrobacter taibaiensis]
MSVPELDPFDGRRAVRADGLLEPFNAIGLLAAADVHVAMRLTALAGETDEAIALAAALAVRAPRHGHVFVDLRRIAETASVDSEDEEIDLSELPWPSPEDWLARLAASPLVAVGEAGFPNRPLRLVGSSLYLDRYWREECRVAEDLLAFGAASVRADVLEAGLDRLFVGGPDDSQRTAAEAAVRRRFAVVAGGPGTGKTTTVARILALLVEQSGGVPPLVALAAPTGKAAQRLEEAVHEAAADPRFEAAREFMLGLSASTLHKLLGARPGTNRRRHHRGNRLPHEVVIVDETSMVSLSMMARLVEAVRPEARLILVGDPDQLSSIEAGAVLSDIVEAGREGVVALDHVFRFGAGIGDLASAIRRNQPEEVLSVLRAEPEGVRWIDVDIAAPDALDKLGEVRAAALAAARAVIAAARAGDAAGALKALGAFRVLCAHRHGSYGVAVWMARIEAWLESELERGRWYAGRPLLVTENDYSLHLRNGDTGVVVATAPGSVSAAFERRGEVVTFAPTRLSAVDTVYAMTVHKSQGSQFETAVVLLPSAASPILTRELLYTAVTRAQKELVLVGTETSVRAAVGRPIARASGLRDRLRA